MFSAESDLYHPSREVTEDELDATAQAILINQLSGRTQNDVNTTGIDSHDFHERISDMVSSLQGEVLALSSALSLACEERIVDAKTASTNMHIACHNVAASQKAMKAAASEVEAAVVLSQALHVIGDAHLVRQRIVAATEWGAAFLSFEDTIASLRDAISALDLKETFSKLRRFAVMKRLVRATAAGSGVDSLPRDALKLLDGLYRVIGAVVSDAVAAAAQVLDNMWLRDDENGDYILPGGVIQVRLLVALEVRGLSEAPQPSTSSAPKSAAPLLSASLDGAPVVSDADVAGVPLEEDGALDSDAILGLARVDADEALIGSGMSSSETVTKQQAKGRQQPVVEDNLVKALAEARATPGALGELCVGGRGSVLDVGRGCVFGGGDGVSGANASLESAALSWILSRLDALLQQRYHRLVRLDGDVRTALKGLSVLVDDLSVVFADGSPLRPIRNLKYSCTSRFLAESAVLATDFAHFYVEKSHSIIVSVLGQLCSRATLAPSEPLVLERFVGSYQSALRQIIPADCSLWTSLEGLSGIIHLVDELRGDVTLKAESYCASVGAALAHQFRKDCIAAAAKKEASAKDDSAEYPSEFGHLVSVVSNTTEGTLTTAVAVDVMQLLRSQIDEFQMAKDLLPRITGAAAVGLTSFTDTLLKSFTSRHAHDLHAANSSKFLSEHPMTLVNADVRLQILCGLANDVRSVIPDVDRTVDRVVALLETPAPGQDRGVAISTCKMALETAEDSLFVASVACVAEGATVLIGCPNSVITRTEFLNHFMSPWETSSSHLERVILFTLRDYLNDISKWLVAPLYGKFVRCLVHLIARQYLSELLLDEKIPALDSNAAARMIHDAGNIAAFFTSLNVPESVSEHSLDAIRHISRFIEASNAVISGATAIGTSLPSVLELMFDYDRDFPATAVVFIGTAVLASADKQKTTSKAGKKAYSAGLQQLVDTARDGTFARNVKSEFAGEQLVSSTSVLCDLSAAIDDEVDRRDPKGAKKRAVKRQAAAVSAQVAMKNSSASHTVSQSSAASTGSGGVVFGKLSDLGISL